MTYDRTLIVIRERSFLDLLDLGFWSCAIGPSSSD